MLRLARSIAVLISLFLSAPVAAQGFVECGFGFEIDTQSSAFQAMTIDGEQKRGFWLSISRAPSDVRALAKYIGRLQICLTTPDGKPRTITRNGQSVTLNSPFVTNCTAALLPNNRLLTNAHCYYDPLLKSAGFTIVREARINFNYTSKDDTGGVRTYLVHANEVAIDEALDAMVLQVIGGDPNGDLGGNIPMKMLTEVEPFQELRLIHHPAAEPQQYSAGTCQVHRRQTEIPETRSPFRHTCESTGGSSGSLLFDARTMAVVALHNQGGLSQSGDSFNGGHKIAMIEEALGLGFTPVSTTPLPPPPSNDAQNALVAALLMTNFEEKRAALEKLIEDYPMSDAASQAKRALQSLDNVSPPPRVPELPVIDTSPKPPVEAPANTDLEHDTLVQAMLSDINVQRCDRLAGSSTHPDRASGAMIAAGLPYAEIDGPRAELACRAALERFPEHPRLLSFLGDALYRQQKYAEGSDMYRRSAALGDVTGQTSMGFILRDGRGVTRDYGQAIAYFQQAAAQNYSGGYIGLGLLYRDGDGVPLNHGQAHSYFTRGVDLGDPMAASFLAELYEFGRGTAVNPERAADLYIMTLQGGISWVIDVKQTWSPATVSALQTRLRNMGYYSSTVDGSIGPGTRAAMERLRQASL